MGTKGMSGAMAYGNFLFFYNIMGLAISAVILSSSDKTGSDGSSISSKSNRPGFGPANMPFLIHSYSYSFYWRAYS